MELNSIYSQTPKEFLNKFSQTIEKEHQDIWDSEFQRYSTGNTENIELEEIFETSDFQQKIYQRHQQKFLMFNNMIPHFDQDELKLASEEIMEDAINLVDYCYCLNGYYSRWDQMIAKFHAALRTLRMKLPINLQNKI